MLTDYHVHLRPDGEDTPFERYMNSENAAVYRDRASEKGIAELGVAEHIYRFTAALDVWDHQLWKDESGDDIDAYCEFVRTSTDLKLGIEADFIPGREEQMRDLLDARDWDYVIGSIHFIGDGALDYAKYDVWNSGRSPEKVWATYFEWLGELAATGMYDVLAHPDLVKHWGRERPVPEGDLRRFYELAIEKIADSGIAIEVSTAGLRKPIGELYPSMQFLQMCVEAGNPVALSSDAHVPDQLGYEYGRALDYLEEAGVTEICVFEKRQRRLEPIG